MPDTEDGPINLVTTLQVDPDNVDEVLTRLRKVRDEVMTQIPGHLGLTVQVSVDRSKILISGAWSSRAAVDAILFDEDMGKQLDYVTEKAKSQESVFYKVVDD